MRTLHFFRKKSPYFTGVSSPKLYLHVCAYAYFYTQYIPILRMQTQRVVSLIPDNRGTNLWMKGNESREEGGRGENRTERAFANSDHMEDRKGAMTPAAPAIRQMDIAGTCALLAVSSRHSCTNKRDTRHGGDERMAERRVTRRE